MRKAMESNPKAIGGDLRGRFIYESSIKELIKTYCFKSWCTGSKKFAKEWANCEFIYTQCGRFPQG
jgi:hypothetical protein